MALQHIQTPPLFRNLAGSLILIGAVVVVICSGASAITRENIDQHLQRFAVYISQTTSDHGKQGKFTYGDIDIDGFGHNKQAVVDRVSLAFSEPAVLDTTTWLVSTDSMRVMPDFTTAGRLNFVFASPINVIKNSQLKTTITASGPIKYGYYEGVQDQKPVVLHTLHLPGQIVFTPGRAVGETANDIGPVVVSYDENPQLLVKYLPDSNEREVNYEFHNLQMVSSTGGVNAGSLTGKYQEGFDQNHLEGTYSVEVKELSFGKDKPGPAYNLQMDISYHGDSPDFNLMEMRPNFGSNAELAFNHAVIAGPDFNVQATGKFATAPDDPLPFGNINIDIDHAGNFLNSDLVPEPLRMSFSTALEKIHKDAIASDTHLTIPLKREKGGVFYIGDTTFEQLMASLLKDSLKQNSTPSAPVLPPANALTKPLAPAAHEIPLNDKEAK